MRKDIISVLMSVYYKEKPEYLTKSLESIFSQTLLADEVVVIKDGHLTIELNQILDTYEKQNKIKVYSLEQNQGLGIALQFGVTKCKGNIIVRMDSDDISSPNRIEVEYKTLIEKKVDLIGSNTIEFEDDIDNIVSKRIMPETYEEIKEYSKTRNPFIHPSIMAYKDKIIECGNYQSCYLVEDYDLWVRMLNKGCIAYNIQENLVFMRVNKDFYKRRGGLKYCKSIVGFKNKLYKQGYMDFGKYVKTKYATIIVSLMPGFVRDFIYRKFLRK